MNDTPRALFLANDAKAKKLHDEHVREFRKRFSAFVDGGMHLKSVFRNFISKADQAREIGIVLIEFSDTLPGGKFTRDFYEQEKEFFTDAAGHVVDFDLLMWFIKIARENLEPIADIGTALKYRQPLLLASGDKKLVLESERPPQRHVPPADPLACFKKLANPSDWMERWQELKTNENYCPAGELRETLRETLKEEMAPTFDVWHDIEARVNGWDAEKKRRVKIAIES